MRAQRSPLGAGLLIATPGRGFGPQGSEHLGRPSCWGCLVTRTKVHVTKRPDPRNGWGQPWEAQTRGGRGGHPDSSHPPLAPTRLQETQPFPLSLLPNKVTLVSVFLDQ